MLSINKDDVNKVYVAFSLLNRMEYAWVLKQLDTIQGVHNYRPIIDNLKHDGTGQIKNHISSINQSQSQIDLIGKSFVKWRRVGRGSKFGNVFPTKKFCFQNEKKIRVGGISWTFFARYPKFQAINAGYTWTSSINVHPSPKVMADFFQTQKLSWRPRQICIIFGGCIKCMQMVISSAKFIDFLH